MKKLILSASFLALTAGASSLRADPQIGAQIGLTGTVAASCNLNSTIDNAPIDFGQSLTQNNGKVNDGRTVNRTVANLTCNGASTLRLQTKRGALKKAGDYNCASGGAIENCIMYDAVANWNSGSVSFRADGTAEAVDRFQEATVNHAWTGNLSLSVTLAAGPNGGGTVAPGTYTDTLIIQVTASTV